MDADERSRPVVRLHIHGVARVATGALEELAAELTASVRSNEPGVTRYCWSRVATSDTWLIEEEYVDHQAFTEHMERLTASGNIRRLGQALEVERVLLLAGDPQAIAQQLGSLPHIVYTRVEAL